LTLPEVPEIGLVCLTIVRWKFHTLRENENSLLTAMGDSAIKLACSSRIDVDVIFGFNKLDTDDREGREER